jgi:hypothetical protein
MDTVLFIQEAPIDHQEEPSQVQPPAGQITAPPPGKANTRLRPCPDCQQSVSINAASCPRCGAKLKKKRGAGRSFLAIVLGIPLGCLLLLAAIGLFFDSGKKETEQEKEAGSAYYAAKKFCERYAPSGKNFTTESGGDYLDGKAERMAKKGDWFASGYVDCQNKYGAMRHQSWGAHVTLRNGKWHLNYLAIGDETLVGGE